MLPQLIPGIYHLSFAHSQWRHTDKSLQEIWNFHLDSLCDIFFGVMSPDYIDGNWKSRCIFLVLLHLACWIFFAHFCIQFSSISTPAFRIRWLDSRFRARIYFLHLNMKFGKNGYTTHLWEMVQPFLLLVKWLPPQFMTISGIHSLPVTWTRAKEKPRWRITFWVANPNENKPHLSLLLRRG